AQFVLERQRVLAMEGAKEMAHEILCPQEQSALAALAELERRGVQQMGLSKAEATMDEQMRKIVALPFGKGARGAVAELVGGSRDETVKGLLRMQHARPKTVGRLVLPRRDIVQDRSALL